MGIGVKIAQMLLFSFNFIFVLVGLAGIVVGTIIRIRYEDYDDLTSKNVGLVSILFLCLGGIILIFSFFGCFGAIRKSVAMLTIYIVLMVILLVIEIAAAIFAYVYKDKMEGYVEDGMEYALEHYNKSKFKEAFDKVQEKFKCCGKSNASDYQLIAKVPIPPSCCDNLGNASTCTKPYKKGCADALFDYLEDHMAIIGGLAAGIAVIQIIGIIFACLVRRDEKQGYNYV